MAYTDATALATALESCTNVKTTTVFAVDDGDRIYEHDDRTLDADAYDTFGVEFRTSPMTNHIQQDALQTLLDHNVSRLQNSLTHLGEFRAYL